MINNETVSLLLLFTLVTAVAADENLSVSNNVSDSNDSPTYLDRGIEEVQKDSPGIEAVYAIAGLLVVAYLVLRQKKN